MYLNCHSYYSLRYGTMSVEQLMQRALAAGTDTIVLTDINNSTGIPEFAGECSKNNIRPVAGIEYRNDNEFIGIRPHELNSLLTLTSSINRSSMVLLQPVTFAETGDIFIHRSLRAVDNNILLSHLQPWQCAREDEFFRDTSGVEKIMKEYPWLLNNTKKLLDDCDLQFDRESLKNKKIYSASRYDDKLLLEKLAWDGMIYRYGRQNNE